MLKVETNGFATFPDSDIIYFNESIDKNPLAHVCRTETRFIDFDTITLPDVKSICGNSFGNALINIVPLTFLSAWLHAKLILIILQKPIFCPSNPPCHQLQIVCALLKETTKETNSLSGCNISRGELSRALRSHCKSRCQAP